MSEQDYTLTNPPNIPSLPEPVPSRSGSQPNFQARANEFLAQLPTFTDSLTLALAWLKQSVDKLDDESAQIAQNLYQSIEQLEYARSQAIEQIEQEVIALLEDLEDPLEDLEEYKEQVLSDIEDAKQAAIQYINDHCGGGGGE